MRFAHTYLALPVFAVALATSCSKEKSSSSNDDSSQQSVSTLRLMVTSPGEPTVAALAVDPDAADFKNKSIASGTPEEVVLYVKKMSLLKEKDAPGVDIFKSTDDPKPITIRGKSVDISELFTDIDCVDANGNVVEVPEGKTCKCGIDANGVLIDEVDVAGDGEKSCPELKEGETPPTGVMAVDQTGTFNHMVVTIANIGKMKGCVSGNFADGNNAPIAKTMCTKADLGITAALEKKATVDDYPAANPELADVSLSKSGPSDSDITLTFPIKGGVTVEKENTPTMTLMIDRGRLLRFFWNSAPAGNSQGPTPASDASASYFFTTVFENSTMVFVGQPGDVRGYEWTTSATTEPKTVSKPGDNVCGDADPCHTVNGWLTVIMDKDGAPIAGTLTPDDDNALTVLKGGNFGSSPGEVDPGLFTKTAEGTYDLKYNLSSQLDGTLFGIDLGMAVDATKTTSFYLGSNQSDEHGWGAVKMKRKL